MKYHSTNVNFNRTQTRNTIIASLCAVFAFCLAGMVFLLDTHDELHEDVVFMVELIDTMHLRGYEISTTLSQMPLQQCNDQQLKQMQRFHSLDPFIKRISYIRDAVSCSTNQVRATRQATIIDTTEGGLQVLLYPSDSEAGQFASYAIRYGHYEVEYSSRLGTTLVPDVYHYEAVYLSKTGPVHVIGDRGIYNPEIENGLHWIYSV